MSSKCKYIAILAKDSKTDSHELVLECMNYYGVNCTKDLSQEQLEEFCRMKGLVIDNVR